MVRTHSLVPLQPFSVSDRVPINSPYVQLGGRLAAHPQLRVLRSPCVQGHHEASLTLKKPDTTALRTSINAGQERVVLLAPIRRPMERKSKQSSVHYADEDVARPVIFGEFCERSTRPALRFQVILQGSGFKVFAV